MVMAWAWAWGIALLQFFGGVGPIGEAVSWIG